MGIANGKDRDLLKKKIKEIKTGVEKEKKIQEKERKAKEKEQKKQLLKKKWREVMVEEAVKGRAGGLQAVIVLLWLHSSAVVYLRGRVIPVNKELICLYVVTVYNLYNAWSVLKVGHRS